METPDIQQIREAKVHDALKEILLKPPSRNVQKDFIFHKAMEFVNVHQGEPLPRAARRKIARDLTKRAMKKGR